MIGKLDRQVDVDGKLILITVASLLLSRPSEAKTDQLIVDGHLTGPRTELKLTSGQETAATVDIKKNGYAYISLTEQQRKQLTKSVSRAKNVMRLLVLPPTAKACACHASDVAVKTSKNTIEVGNSYLGRVIVPEEKLMQDELKKQMKKWEASQKSTAH